MAKKSDRPRVPPTSKKMQASHRPPKERIAPSQELEETSEMDEERRPGFGVVAIGASAGGLEAFTQFLQALATDTGMAYVFVQHLDPKHVSILKDLLQRQTALPVTEAQQGTHMEPNHVYVIPSNANMRVMGGVLTLSPRQAGGQNMPIDMFFRSLAADLRGRAIGIILSGNASDGSLGMRAIKEEGGITFAQDSESAKFDSMPRSAVAAGCVDFVLPPDKIAKELARLSHHPYVSPLPKGASDLIPDGSDGLNRIIALIRAQTGVDFTYYKQTTIKRRILRRMAVHKIDNVDRYVARLRIDAAEVQAIYEDFLINVTEFFRDPEAFEALKKSVFPKFFENQERGPVRIWVPGCSTGEEVYSMAISLLEYMDEQTQSHPFQIFGTDISERALEKARTGTYGLDVAQTISRDRLRRFFLKTEGGYQINKRIREMCVFAKQNLVKDPPFSKLDLISCRNVLIYLGPLLQRRIVPIFHYALKPSGILFLGSSETIGTFQDLFQLAEKKNKIFSRLPVAARLPSEFGLVAAAPTKADPPLPEQWSEPDILREADRIALAKYAPAGVVIDDEMTIIQFRGHTGPYLEPVSGAASLNLLRMTREALSVELRGAVNRAKQEDKAVRRDGLRLRDDGELREFAIEVVPFKRLSGRNRLFLVLFEPATPASRAQVAGDRRKRKNPDISAMEAEIAQLQQDLKASKEYLQSIIEEQEASNEELRSANEEIQSSNEELQSTNEELNTVNEELQTRNAQINEAGNDLLNLLSNVNIPIVMLGTDLRIRRFTPISERVLNLIPSDVGRPISDLRLNIDIGNLQELLVDAIENLSSKVVDTQDWNGRRYSLRIRPYRTEDNRIDGVVMVLVDLNPPDQSSEAPIQAAPDGNVRPEVDLQQSGQTATNLRLFTRSLLAAQEEERRRVSRELHDELNQKLALLELDVQTLEQKPPTPKKIPEALRSVRLKVTELSDDLRRIAYQLHPSALDDLGLTVVLESYIRDFSERQGIAVAFHHNGYLESLPPNVALTAYRIVQESMRNISKHSHASSVEVTIEGSSDHLNLVVADSGVGFDPEEVNGQGGLGLTSMEERVQLLEGEFQIVSKPGQGTKVKVKIPLAGGDQAVEA